MKIIISVLINMHRQPTSKVKLYLNIMGLLQNSDSGVATLHTKVTINC